MAPHDGLEFVNRHDELLFLDQCLAAAMPLPALVFLRGPSGVGKSSLTERFVELRDAPDLPFRIVEPNIVESPVALSLYQGLFLQRCAAALNQAVTHGSQGYQGFGDFLRTRRWKTAREKPKHELLSELPSAGSVYKQAADYAARLFSFGRFDPEFLLVSDQSHAVNLCTAYVEETLDTRPMVLVVREAQLIDLFSLRSLLGWQVTGTRVHLIFEYTTERAFAPDHQKTILKAAQARGQFSIYDIKKLGLDHLQQLIRSNVRSDFRLETEAHFSWDGNLRSVLELKFRVGVGQTAALPANVQGVLEHLEQSIADHVAALSPQERIVLALIHANGEPLPEAILRQTLSATDQSFRPPYLSRVLGELITVHGFIQRTGDGYRIHNETIAQAISATATIRPLLALSEKMLRDHYRSAVAEADFRAVGMPAAVRQVFRLCVATKDVTGLVIACRSLLDQVKASQDQALYVDAVSSALDAEPELFRGDYEELRLWAASLAYDTSDWTRAASLLETSGAVSSYARAMRACALQEIGGHDEALALADAIKKDAISEQELIVARLIAVLVRGCRGDTDFARAELQALIATSDGSGEPLIGYAYRFFDIVGGLAETLPMLQASVAWFDRFDLRKARAYSELPTAMILARFGRLSEARTLVASALDILSSEIRDQHIILNNRAAIELLADTFDPGACVELLQRALRSARDDFSELTITTNLALAQLAAGSLEAAAASASRALDILREHDFADRDIYWPVCFNAAHIFGLAGCFSDKAEALRLLEANKIVSANQGYWDYRFGITADAPLAYSYLTTRETHPLYLSHWTIELEGLSSLIQGSPL
jgi:tetratricopeptide (TPR) repeat protein